MFGNKENINILTSLLIAHGVKKAVVCPGSRNAPIVHNLNECMDCYPVTDERSAGFYALGMSLADDTPVVVCVTSGTALLNLAPAVAEASYRHHGLIVISADRPRAWIGQLDGQTLPQHDALGCFVGKCVDLPEPHDDEERWYCNRLVNEALLSVRSRGQMSVHINVPISEPLFEFGTKFLPSERKISFVKTGFDAVAFEQHVSDGLLAARRPMIVVGQINSPSCEFEKLLTQISERIAVLSEPLSVGFGCAFDLVLSCVPNISDYQPDFLLYIGETLVSKRLKRFLRQAGCHECWAVSENGGVHDTFMNLSGVVECTPMDAISVIAKQVVDEQACGNRKTDACDFAGAWNGLFGKIDECLNTYEPVYSQFAVVKLFEQSLRKFDYKWHVHYANSNAVRLACMCASHYIWCNRGVNGIEGSLSVAAGFSLATADIVFCVIGDLSFFYDQNALWNTNLDGNLRIILLNNSCGGIFYSLKGLHDSPAFEQFVAGAHATDAKGICIQNNVGYFAANDMDSLRSGINWIMTSKAERPMLLEVFTDAKQDNEAIKELTYKIQQQWHKENGKR